MKCQKLILIKYIMQKQNMKKFSYIINVNEGKGYANYIYIPLII